MDKVSIIGDAARHVRELQKDVEDGEADVATLVAILQRAITSRCDPEDLGTGFLNSLISFPLLLGNTSLENVSFQPSEITKVISLSLSLSR